MTGAIPADLVARLVKQVGPRCGYCRTSAKITGQPLTVEHLLPLSRGGDSEESNLWLSCRRCNEYKGAQIEARDPETGTISPLFDPRRQRWQEHFAWSGDGAHILGRTPCGRATVAALNLNNDDILAARRLWAGVGWHPPLE